VAERRWKIWGWGYEGDGLDPAEERRLRQFYAARFGVAGSPPPLPKVDDVPLRAPRIRPPAALAPLCSTEPYERLLHTYGKSFPDAVRAFARDFKDAPDLVAKPRSEADVVALLDWAADANAAVIPFGGGSSVCGGVDPVVGDRFAGTVSLDLKGLDQVLEIDRASRAARIQGGILGPALEASLKPHALTLRHFPQSFEFSTLGGWLATRSGGHYATVYTHIDDLVESMRVVTPSGVAESRRLPGSGAGPSPDRQFLGSEGSLGVITEAWMRLQDRPRWKASAGLRFASFHEGAEAVRALSQSALFPTNCRLLDAGEAAITAGVAAVVPGGALLVLGFESADHPVGPWLDRGLELCADHGGTWPADEVVVSEAGDAGRAGAAGAWRGAFVRAPYTRDGLVRCGVLVETFETACTWDRFPTLHADVTAAVEKALAEVCGGGWVTCRFTHAYPDGCAPYFSVLAPGRPGAELEQWAEIKAAASEVLLASGATITHHHAVGRDHDPWYRRQRPEAVGRALAAAKRELDPSGILNPDVIV